MANWRNNVVPMPKTFVNSARELKVYQVAYAVSLEIHKESLSFPKMEQYALADQIRRASKSICANLSEGFAKQPHSTVEFRRFISIAIGSAGEMETWISYCHDLGYISPVLRDAWLNQYDHILRMLTKLRSPKE